MKHLKLPAIILAPLLFATGCDTLSQDNRAMIEQTMKTTAALEKSVQELLDREKAMSEQLKAALAEAGAASQSASAAADAASKAASEAKAAGDKADRIFRKNLRK